MQINTSCEVKNFLYNFIVYLYVLYNTFFNDLQSVEVGDVVTIETHYGTYTYTVERCEVRDYQDTTTYDFTRTDENLILYTCYPFDALGFTPNRYFVYASYTSGPELDADR